MTKAKASAMAENDLYPITVLLEWPLRWRWG
jgi:hypothetical protein